MSAQQTFVVATAQAGCVEITGQVEQIVRESRILSGIAHVFCQHTSASLVIMENADPSALQDLEAWLNRLVPDDDPAFTHTAEGADDMPSHIKMALTRTAECVPVSEGRLALGTWQGIFLWEHRRRPHRRKIVVTIVGV